VPLKTKALASNLLTGLHPFFDDAVLNVVKTERRVVRKIERLPFMNKCLVYSLAEERPYIHRVVLG